MLIGIDASRANVAERTGTERYAWEVIRRLVERAPQHRFRLYVREPLLADWPTLPPNVEVAVLRWPPKILWSHVRLSVELLFRRPDVLFVPADTVPLIHPRQTVTTIHDVAFERFPELYRQKSIQRRLGFIRPILAVLVRIVTLGRYGLSEGDYHRWSVRQAVRSCPQILTVSEFSKREIVETLHAQPERITVTPLGIRQSEERRTLSVDERQAVQQKYQVVRPYIIFIGRLEKKKNIGLLIAAYAEYRQRTNEPVDLVLIGTPGFGWDEAQRVCQEQQLNQAVHQLGWVNDDDTEALLSGAVAFVYISQYEGFGIPALDAMVVGVPVLASRHGSLPEVLGQAALYTETNIPSVRSAIEQIVSDQSLRAALVTQGKNHVRQYTWEQTTLKTEQIVLRTALSK